MDALAGLTDGGEKVVELLLAVHKKGHGVVVGESHSLSTQLAHDDGIAALGMESEGGR